MLFNNRWNLQQWVSSFLCQEIQWKDGRRQKANINPPSFRRIIITSLRDFISVPPPMLISHCYLNLRPISHRGEESN